METLVQFRNASRKVLRGMIHRPAGRAGRRGVPAVVFFHGFTSDRMESHWIFVKCSRALARAGIASLRFDFFGSGESEGDFTEASLQSEMSDAMAAVEFLRRQRGINPHRLALLGMSLGGAVAAMIAHRARVQSLVLWSAPAELASLASIASQVARPVPGRSDLVDYNAHPIPTAVIDGIQKMDPLRQVALFHQPTLMIHAENDAYLPISHAERYLKAAGTAVKQLLIIPGSDHTFTSLTWECEVIGRSVEWLKAHLLEPA
jgi:uncharacterized protein